MICLAIAGLFSKGHILNAQAVVLVVLNVKSPAVGGLFCAFGITEFLV